MYAFLEGTLVSVAPGQAIIQVGGVGYRLRIPTLTEREIATKAGTSLRLYTYLHVTEEAHTLFGFSADEDRMIFELLLGASGVGPGTALSALSQMPGRELATAIMTGNAAALQRVKGLGAKTAQKLVLDLKTRMLKVLTLSDQELSSASGGTVSGGGSIGRQEALQALVTLGIARASAEKTLDALLEKDPSMSTEDLIRQALRQR